MSKEKPHKTSDPEISSHTSLFWTLPEQFSKLQRAFPQICPKPMSKEKPHKTSDPEISSHTSLFWTLPEQLSKLQRALPQIYPKPMSQEKNTKPQTPRFHLTHPCFELCPNSSPSYTADDQPWISCLQESYTTTHFCKAIHYGPKKQRDKHRDPCVLAMSFDVFWCLLMSFHVLKYIQIGASIFKYTIYKSRCTSSKCEREVLEATSEQS